MRNLFILILLLLNQALYACSYAYQYSLYPMGASGGQLVVLEVELERYVNHPDFNPMGAHDRVFSADIESRWKGSIRLCYWKNGKLELIEAIGKKIDFSDSDYEKGLQPYMQAGYDAAQALPFFEPAELERCGVCHYDIACPFFQKKVNGEAGTAACYLEEAVDVRYPMPIPMGILQKFEARTNERFTKFEELDATTRGDFYRIWKPYSVRVYTIGGEQYLAFTLGWGQKLPTPVATETEWRRTLPPVELFTEGREVLLHGYRFDFITRKN